MVAGILMEIIRIRGDFLIDSKIKIPSSYSPRIPVHF